MAHAQAAALREGAAALGLELDAESQRRLLDFLDLLLKWSRVHNLTALRTPQQALTHHVLDSLAVVAPLRRHTDGHAATVLDAGSGGGLPGVVLAVCCPELVVTCVDAVRKKVAFVQQVRGRLGLTNLRAEHARVEDLPGPFDVVTARAFAALPDLVDWTGAALAPAGVWMALKGRRPEAELAALPATVEVFHVEPLQVPALGAERHLVWMRRAIATA